MGRVSKSAIDDNNNQRPAIGLRDTHWHWPHILLASRFRDVDSGDGPGVVDAGENNFICISCHGILSVLFVH
jgi:hypothetical protein